MSVVNIADVHPMQSLLLDHDIASRESDNINDRSHHPRTSCCSPRIRSNRGSCNVPSCTLCLLLGGILLGVSLPTNPDIPSHAWQILSNVIGYTYFLAWSSSFYPQIMLNYQRKKTNGLSVDFCVLNVLGYICYTVYTTNFYWNQNVISAYKDRTSGGDGAITVQGNDVAFSIHALVMASVTLCQVGVYDTFRARPPSRRTYIILFSVVTFCILYTLFMWMCRGRFDLLGFLYVLGTIKVGVTIGKYVPQALLNRSRKSTIGWNVNNVLLDLTGGVLSLLQLVGDSTAMSDWTGITGNPAKIALSLLIFIAQHYMLYPDIDESRSYSPLPSVESTATSSGLNSDEV